MKRKLFLLLCALLTMIGVQAVEWSGNAPAAGDFYLYNVKSGKFLQFGANYGTRAVLVDGAGEIITFAASGDNFKMTFPNITKASKGLFLAGGDTPYCDNEAEEFTFTETSAGSKTYTISRNEKYLACREDFSAEPSPLETIDDASSDRATWKIVSRQDRIDALASATKANPVDATFYISGAEIDQFFNNAGAWEGNDPTYGGRTGNLEATGYAAENFWGENASSYQDLTSIVNGRYVVSCYGFYRDGAWNEVAEKHNAGTEVIGAHLFANSNSTPLSSIMDGAANTSDDGGREAEPGKWIPDAMDQAVLYFFRGRYPAVEVEANVTDGNLRIGISKDASTAQKWTIWDRFRLKYYGPTISTQAVALPDGGAMEADTWYYFDIAVAGDNYNATATALGDIVYTTDGTILIEDQASVTATFAATDNSLSATRYYVKSSSAQASFSIAAASYSYSVSDASVDVSYIQPGNTVTVSYTVATNDPSATLAQDYSGVTFDEVAINVTPGTNGFTFTVPANLEAGVAHTLYIPAGAIGYAAGSTYNVEQSIVLNAVAVFDGVYYLYDATNKLFLGRGANYSTRAVADKYGVAMTVATNANGISNFTFLDGGGNKLFDANGGNLYTDNTTYPNFAIESTAGGYYVVNKNTTASSTYDGKLYIDGESNVIVSTTNSTVWSLLTDAERDAIVDAYPTDNINTVIAAAGISTTAAEFEAFLSANYDATDKTNSIGTATFAGSVGDWAWAEVRHQDNQPAYGTNFAELWNATGTYSQTVSDLPAGIYKLTVDGFERRATVDISNTLGAAGYNLVSSYLAANDEQVRLTDWYTTSKPGNTAGAVTAFNNGEATNELYIYLDGNTDLNIKLVKPNYVWDCWTIFNNFTLTCYTPKSVSVTIGAEGYATLGSQYPLDLTPENLAEGVKAYKATSVNGETIQFVALEQSVPANTGLLIAGTPGEVTIPVAASSTPVEGENLLKVNASGETFDAEVGCSYYGLLKDTKEFHPFAPATVAIPANKAYLRVENINPARLIISFDEEEDPTAINVIEAANAKAEGLKDGKYLIGNKVVLVKNGVKYGANGQKLN